VVGIESQASVAVHWEESNWVKKTKKFGFAGVAQVIPPPSLYLYGFKVLMIS